MPLQYVRGFFELFRKLLTISELHVCTRRIEQFSYSKKCSRISAVNPLDLLNGKEDGGQT
jgi:hypothetical protein